MSPKLFEINNGRIILTENAFLIKETRELIDKYGEGVDPYVAFCHLLSAIDSPLRNLPEEERIEAAVFEVNSLYGEFDEYEPLLDKCIEKLRHLYATPIYNLFEGLGDEVNNILYYLKTTPLSSDDYSQRVATIEKAGRLALSLAAAKKTAEEDMKQNTRGDQETGQIY